MARVRYLPSDFRYKADFGTYQSTPNKFTGVSVPKFVKQFTIHYKPHTRTLNQEYLAQQNGESDTIVIVIRHNAKVLEGQVVTLNGTQYDIVRISPDENFGFNHYDFLTLRKHKKVG